MTLRPKSLAVTLALWYVAVLTVLIAAAGFFVYRTFESRLLAEADRTARSIAGEITRDWGFTRGLSWAQAIDAGERRHEGLGVTALLVALDESGEPSSERTVGSGRPRPDGLLLDRATYASVEHADENGRLLTLRRGGESFRVALFDMRGPYVLQVSLPLAETESRMRHLALLLGAGGAALLALASIGGRVIVQRALRPVNDVVAAARALSADDLSLRIDGGGRQDEIGELAATFNAMLDRLEASVARMKQFTADVSHELRTPLTVVRGEIDVALRRPRAAGDYRATLESVQEEMRTMSVLVEDLLFLSRLDARPGRPASEAALDEVALRAFERLEPLARERKIGVDLDGIRPAAVRGDERLLERLVSNLLDNAFRHTPEGGRVALTVTPAGEAGGASLAVSDTGAGIPAEAIPRLFERFFVVDPSRSRESGGTGLGLAIVKSIADLHGAAVRIDSRVGEGTTVEVAFAA
ncbi:MAG TPA: ATP-binding protein [Vicinamibacterales bacterium]|nr:ATP-binding protein [Vicinamibacterales bacterium]HOQ59241.1 ATP-binding protein [Vicinamibacterales bacterium]HPK70545.1 ATP-binding protein [Vicinamibacterales bacterium]